MILIPLLAIVILSEPAWNWYNRNLPVDYTKDQAKLDSLVALWDADSVLPTEKEIAPRVYEKFQFDPNSASAQDLERLGFPATLAARIVRYREKGGKFKAKGDLLKIYGIDTSFYRQLRPWVRLPDQRRSKERQKFERKAFARRPVPARINPFDVNIADTAQLRQLRGIGEKLSQRIIKYRDGLGGFVRIGQLSEVYGLDSVVVENLVKFAFVSEDFKPKLLNINTTDAKTLGAHPYLTDKEARSIVAYRFQHGNFGSLDELRAVQVLTEENLMKVLPYLTTTN
ncbi:MAG: helix-hairpin-helix domain-containing protein [Chryseolinea sp.]